MKLAARPQTKSGSLFGVIALTSLVALSGACAFAYYSWHLNRYPSWREEVRLSDGRTIQITQKHEYYANHGTTQSWVTFSLPEIGGKRTWHSYLTPQRIDVVGGRVFVFGFPRGDRQYAYYKYPKNYMVAFVWNGTEFRRLPFLNLPAESRIGENVLSCVPAGLPRFVSLAKKSQSWCPPRGDEEQFRQIIDLKAYQSLAEFFARLDGGKPISE